MTDILEHGADVRLARLLPEQQILDTVQGALRALIDEVIPRAGVAVQHGGRLDGLAPLAAAAALEGVVSVGARVGLELEQLAQRVEGEVALDVLGRVNDA